MLDKEKEQLKDWEAREDFVQELSAAAEVRGDELRFHLSLSLSLSFFPSRGIKMGLRFVKNTIQWRKKRERKVKKCPTSFCNLSPVSPQAAKREERERRRGAVKVPPPRPAFPKTAAFTGSVKIAGTNEIREGEKEGESEEEIWARLEKQEAEEKEGEEKEEGEEGGEEEKEEGEGEELARGHEAGEGSGGSSRPAATITFKHSETVPCLEDTTAPVRAVAISEVVKYSFS